MSRGRKNANAELNLVPYIDLLSTLICFLLITAVWQQISAVTTNGSDPTTASSEGAPPPDPNRIDLSVTLYLDHIDAVAGLNKSTVQFIGGKPDYGALIRVLRYWKDQWPDRSDVSLHSDSQAPYKHLIGIMDTLKEAQFEDIGVNTN